LTNTRKARLDQRVVISSRHQASIEFLENYCRNHGLIVVAKLSHIDRFETLPECEFVIGNLPLEKVAELNRQGIRYGALSITVPPKLRGVDLSREVLEGLSPRVIEYEASEKGEII
jgi:putative CRISPR-associated protein (TIGR02620 family)